MADICGVWVSFNLFKEPTSFVNFIFDTVGWNDFGVMNFFDKLKGSKWINNFNKFALKAIPIGLDTIKIDVPVGGL